MRVLPSGDMSAKFSSITSWYKCPEPHQGASIPPTRGTGQCPQRSYCPVNMGTDEKMNTLRTHSPSPHNLPHYHPLPKLPTTEEIPEPGATLLTLSSGPINHCVQPSAITDRGTYRCHVSSGPGEQSPISPANQFP